MNDLERRLRTLTDGAPSGPADLERVVARGRTVRRRRLALTAAAGVVALVGAATLVTSLVRDPAPSPFVEDAPRPSPTAAASPGDEETTASDEVGEIAVADVPLPLGLIDDEGLHPSERADVPAIEGSVTVAFTDGEGGIVYQREDEPRSIRWRHADGTEEEPVPVEPGPTTLVGTVRWDGDLYVALSATVPDAEVPTVRLMLHRRPPPESGELLTPYSTDVEVDGGIEGVALTPDGRLVASVCHLQCRLTTVDLSAAAQGQDPLEAEELSEEPRMTWGLDGTDDGRLVTVFSEFPGPLGRAWLEIGSVEGDAADGSAPDVTATRIELPVDDTTDGAWVQATSDGTAAIVELREGGETTGWLLVDRLDTASHRVRRITGVAGQLVLLDPPPTWEE